MLFVKSAEGTILDCGCFGTKRRMKDGDATSADLVAAEKRKRHLMDASIAADIAAGGYIGVQAQMTQADSYGQLINNEIFSTAVTEQSDNDNEEASGDESSGFCEISLIEAEEKYPTPEKCELFLCSYHLVLPISQTSLEQFVQGSKRIVFLDVESVPMIITNDYADTLLFVMYAKKLTWNLPLNLFNLLDNKKLFFVCAESGKERADGLIDALHVTSLKLWYLVLAILINAGR